MIAFLRKNWIACQGVTKSVILCFFLCDCLIIGTMKPNLAFVVIYHMHINQSSKLSVQFLVAIHLPTLSLAHSYQTNSRGLMLLWMLAGMKCYDWDQHSSPPTPKTPKTCYKDVNAIQISLWIRYVNLRVSQTDLWGAFHGFSNHRWAAVFRHKSQRESSCIHSRCTNLAWQLRIKCLCDGYETTSVVPMQPRRTVVFLCLKTGANR